MSFNAVVKESIARTIGEFFTTNQIVNVFNDANIPTERELFAKWRIILDAFSKMSDPEAAIPYILKVFCHPLHFADPQIRDNFIAKLNTTLAYEDLKIQATNKGAEILTSDGSLIDAPPSETKKPVVAESEPRPKIRRDKEDESYFFENGMPYAGCALELFIVRKILEKKTRPIFAAKEFSFKQHSYAEICYVIDKLLERGIVSLCPNTTPEDLAYDDEECEELFGGEEHIKWSVVKRAEKDPNELKWAGFDFDIYDEVQLRGIIDIGVSEFMNDKRYGEFGDLVDLASLSSNELTYEQQRGIVLKDLKENGSSEALINISDYRHPKVDIVRTLLSLEREGVLRVKGFSWECRKNPKLERANDGPENIKDFGDKDEVYATIRLIQPISAVQEIKITAMPEVPVRFVGNTPFTQVKKKGVPIELSFPEPVQWEKVELKIKEGRQELEICYDNSHIITADYIRLGFFSGKKQQKPDRQWGFLCALATLAATDIKRATAENMRSMITIGKTLSVNNVQQVKKLFAERLQDIFKTRNDPFRDNRVYYEPKFTLLPEPSLRREELWPQGGRLNKNRGGETDHLAYQEKRAQEEAEE